MWSMESLKYCAKFFLDVHFREGKGLYGFHQILKVSMTSEAGKLLDWTIARSQFDRAVVLVSSVSLESCVSTWTALDGSLRESQVLSPPKLQSQSRGANHWMQEACVCVQASIRERRYSFIYSFHKYSLGPPVC